MQLTVLAADLLRAPSCPSAHVAVAVAALSEAARHHLDVPADTAMLLWHAVEREPSSPWASTATEAVGLLANRKVVQTIILAITAEGATRELRVMGLDVLSDPHAAMQVTDSELLHLVEVVRGRQVSSLANVIQATSEGRMIAPATMTAIVQRWIQSADLHARHAALEVVGLLPCEEAAGLIERLLIHDPAASVREAAVFVLEEVLEPEVSLVLLDRALEREERGGVRIEMDQVRMDLVADSERSIAVRP